jgi:hypothetical protein
MAVMERAGRWAALKIVRRVGKAIPFVGGLVAVGFLAHAVRRKGVVGGVVDTTLDAIPFVGLVKNGIELFTDDWIPDRPPRTAAALPPFPLEPDPVSRDGEPEAIAKPDTPS